MIRKILILLTLSAITLFADLEIYSDFENAKVESEKEQKILMLMISSEQCPTCEYMKDIVFEDENVIEYLNGHFVTMIGDLDAKNYPEQYKAFGTPTYYFIDPKTGEKIGRQVAGGANAKDFLAKLKEINKMREK